MNMNYRRNVFEQDDRHKIASKNSRIVPCLVCKQEMILVEGTILYDGKWYHEKCWNVTKSNSCGDKTVSLN